MDNADPSSDETCADIVKNAIETSSIPGLSRIGKGRFLVRSLYLLTILSLSGTATRFVILSINTYLEYKQFIQDVPTGSDEPHFPMITVCLETYEYHVNTSEYGYITDKLKIFTPVSYTHLTLPTKA